MYIVFLKPSFLHCTEYPPGDIWSITPTEPNGGYSFGKSSAFSLLFCSTQQPTSSIFPSPLIFLPKGVILNSRTMSGCVCILRRNQFPLISALFYAHFHFISYAVAPVAFDRCSLSLVHFGCRGLPGTAYSTLLAEPHPLHRISPDNHTLRIHCLFWGSPYKQCVLPSAHMVCTHDAFRLRLSLLFASSLFSRASSREQITSIAHPAIAIKSKPTIIIANTINAITPITFSPPVPLFPG